jgi:hypothetical protein
MSESELIKNRTVRSLFKKAARTERIAFRLSRQDKISIRKASRSVNVSMSNYLLNLHRFAVSPMGNTRPTVIGSQGTD